VPALEKIKDGMAMEGVDDCIEVYLCPKCGDRCCGKRGAPAPKDRPPQKEEPQYEDHASEEPPPKM
jgi:hypothetical protein